MRPDLTDRVAELSRHRVPYAHATVVRAQAPTSAHAGDIAIVHADGHIEGFVGGHCAADAVRQAGLDVLERDAGVLLRILPDDSAHFPEASGARVVVNPCLSGGALEIFLEPRLPPDVVHLAGSTPISDAVAFLAEHLGFDVARAEDGRAGAVASIVCIQGGDEPGAIRSALDAGVGYIGLVASEKRGTVLLDDMDLSEDDRARVHTPAGLAIGAASPPEIALSIMAEVVEQRRLGGLTAPTAAAVDVPPATRPVDPVCGMTVTAGPDTPHLEIGGHHYWFCCPACRDSYARDIGPTENHPAES